MDEITIEILDDADTGDTYSVHGLVNGCGYKISVAKADLGGAGIDLKDLGVVRKFVGSLLKREYDREHPAVESSLGIKGTFTMQVDANGKVSVANVVADVAEVTVL